MSIGLSENSLYRRRLNLPQPLTKTQSKSSELPLTLADAKNHLRIAHNDLDSEIVQVIAAATDYCEHYAAVSLRVATQRTATYATWPLYFIRFQTQRVISVDSVDYIDSNGDSQTVDSSNYTLVESTGGGAILEFDTAFSQPTLADRLDAVQITYTAGFPSVSEVPPAATHAIKLMLTALWGDDSPQVLKQAQERSQALLASVEWGWYR